MTTFLLSFAKKYWGSAAILAMAVVAGLQFAAHEREIGRLQMQLASADSTIHARSAEIADLRRVHVVDSSRSVALERDTAVANRKARTADAKLAALAPALASSRRALDSAMQVAQQTPDSGSQGILDALRPYLAKADSSQKACLDDVAAQRDALTKCEQHAAAVQRDLDTQNKAVIALVADTVGFHNKIRALEVGMPSAAGTWFWRAVAFGAGLLAGKIGK